MSADCPEKLPKVVDFGYMVHEMIDYGSFGDIFKVTNESNNATFALKQVKFRGDFKDDPYIISELYCLTKLKHKNIIQMHEIIIRDSEINIIMEYAEKGNLEMYIEGHPDLESHQKYKIFAQILEGVKFCHSMDIAHRDITPVNILLTNDMVVKIADFGLAVKCLTPEGDPVLCQDFLGRSSYLPPEVISQTPFLPKPADVWSLGITLLFLLFRSVPYKELEPQILADQLAHFWKVFVQKVLAKQGCRMKKDVFDFLERAFVIEPSKRVNVSDMIRAWDDLGPDDFIEKMLAENGHL